MGGHLHRLWRSRARTRARETDEHRDALVATGVTPRRVLMVGGGAASEAVRRIAPAVLGLPVVVPEPGEYVADGACRQAAWALSGAATAPSWALTGTRTYQADPTPQVRARYAEAAASAV